MPWTIIAILVVLWLLGLIGGIGGSLIHALLVIAAIVLIGVVARIYNRKVFPVFAEECSLHANELYKVKRVLHLKKYIRATTPC